ncbi:microtubule-associated protein 9 [Porphyrio hochstetteri]
MSGKDGSSRAAGRRGALQVSGGRPRTEGASGRGAQPAGPGDGVSGVWLPAGFWGCRCADLLLKATRPNKSISYRNQSRGAFSLRRGHQRLLPVNSLGNRGSVMAVVLQKWFWLKDQEWTTAGASGSDKTRVSYPAPKPSLFCGSGSSDLEILLPFDELQEAASAHAARQQTDEYSDDFESDEDHMLNEVDKVLFSGAGQELHESNSSAESTKKSAGVESLLSDDDASQKAADTENEAADDLTLSSHEKKLQEIKLLGSENRKDGEEKCLESQNEDDDRKGHGECSAAEVPCADSESDRCKDLPIGGLQKKRKVVTLSQKGNKPTPKPRLHKARNASASAEVINILTLDGCYKPLPQPRSILKKSGPLEKNELNRSKGKITSRNGLSSVSTPSSLSTRNARAVPRKKLLTENPCPEGPWLESTSPPFSINFTSHNERSGDSNLLMCGEAPTVKDQDQKSISTSDLKMENKGRKSPSVIEMMMTTVYEKAKEFAVSNSYSSDKKVKIVEEQIAFDTKQDLPVKEQSEHGEAENPSESSVKKVSETKESGLQNPEALPGRSLSSTYLMKKAKAVPAAPVSSQYLGTLKVLEDKCVQKNSTEFDKADSLRAAVFQNWLEKKNAFLLELKRIEKKKAEELRKNTEKEAVKREEAIASFEAWKKKKEIEAKKLSKKRKLEELKRKKAAQQNEEKMEVAQKAYEKWKEKKMESLREQSRKEQQSERIRKKKEEKLVAEKKRDSMSAFEKWNEKKEEYMKQKKVEQILERRNQEIEQAKKEEKSKKALEEYERWLEKKERKEQLEKQQKKLQAVRGHEASHWSPPGKVMYSRDY